MTRTLSWLFGLLAGATVVLVGVNIYFVLTNQRLQKDVSERQQFIAQSVRLQGLTKEVVNALANHAVKTNDEAVKELLAANGIRVTVNPAAATPAPGAPPASAPQGRRK